VTTDESVGRREPVVVVALRESSGGLRRREQTGHRGRQQLGQVRRAVAGCSRRERRRRKSLAAAAIAGTQRQMVAAALMTRLLEQRTGNGAARAGHESRRNHAQRQQQDCEFPRHRGVDSSTVSRRVKQMFICGHLGFTSYDPYSKRPARIRRPLIEGAEAEQFPKPQRPPARSLGSNNVRGLADLCVRSPRQFALSQQVC
jgi:hypothetical protein